MSKAISDKVDFASVKRIVHKEDLTKIAVLLEQTGGILPNRFNDVYKNRRGKYTRVRIWYYQDLGTCRITSLFVTDENNEPVDVSIIRSKVGEYVCPIVQSVNVL